MAEPYYSKKEINFFLIFFFLLTHYIGYRFGYGNGFEKADLENKVELCVNARLFQVRKQYADKWGTTGMLLGEEKENEIQKKLDLNDTESYELRLKDWYGKIRAGVELKKGCREQILNAGDDYYDNTYQLKGFSWDRDTTIYFDNSKPRLNEYGELWDLCDDNPEFPSCKLEEAQRNKKNK